VAAVALGIGAGSLAAGAVTGLMAVHRKGIVDAHCNAAKACDAIGFEASTAGSDLLKATALTLTTGVLCTALGAYLLSTAHTAPRASASPAFLIAPFVGGLRF
jgi:hypothetical protein